VKKLALSEPESRKEEGKPSDQSSSRNSGGRTEKGQRDKADKDLKTRLSLLTFTVSGKVEGKAAHMSGGEGRPPSTRERCKIIPKSRREVRSTVRQEPGRKKERTALQGSAAAIDIRSLSKYNI